MDTEKINFRQSRDFGETFNVSVKFLRQNFKMLFQSLLFIGGPFVLIAAIATGYNSYNVLSVPRAIYGENLFQQLFDNMGWPYVISTIASGIANTALIGVVFSYMINYMEKGPGQFTVNDVGKTFTRNLGKIAGIFISYTLIMILIIIVISVIAFGITTAVVVLGVLLIVGIVIGLMILGPPLLWQLSAVYLIRMQENKGVFESFGRTREVMRGNFWWTWVIIFCSVMSVMVIALIFALPQVIYQAVFTATHISGEPRDLSFLFLIVSSICSFCIMIVYSIVHVVNAFHYYSLAEEKDGTGLMERINEIGKTPENNVDQQY